MKEEPELARKVKGLTPLSPLYIAGSVIAWYQPSGECQKVASHHITAEHSGNVCGKQLFHSDLTIQRVVGGNIKPVYDLSRGRAGVSWFYIQTLTRRVMSMLWLNHMLWLVTSWPLVQHPCACAFMCHVVVVVCFIYIGWFHLHNKA